MIIGFAGPIGAGKTTGALHLRDHFGYGYVRYSDVLRGWRGDAAMTKSGLQTIGWEVMAGGLQRELNDLVIAQADSIDASSVAIDGLRHEIDQQALSARYGRQFLLLYIEAPAEVRCRRKVSDGTFQTDAQCLEADAHSVEQPSRLLRAAAHRVIENVGSLEQYFRILDKTMESITGSES